MRTSLLSGLLLAIAFAGPAAADTRHAPGESAERSAETLSTLVLLPSSANGTLSFKKCLSCAMVTLSATPTSIYRIGTRNASLAEVAKLFATGRSYHALVAWKLDAQVLLRLEVYLPETGKE